MKQSYIINYHSPDVDLEHFSPQDPEVFCFLLQLFIGEKGERGEECFDVFVCTPKWIERHYSKQAIIIGLHTIIVQEFNLRKLMAAIEERFCVMGESWDEISNQIRFFGLSEFDNTNWNRKIKTVKCGEPER